MLYLKISEKISKLTVIGVSALMSVFGVFCIYDRFTHQIGEQDVQIIAAGVAMPDGAGVGDNLLKINTKSNTSRQKQTDNTSVSSNSSKTGADIDTDYAVKDRSAAIDHTGEQTFLVTESLYRESNMSYGNFFVKNSTDLKLDLGGYLKTELPYKLEDTSEPQVLIVHTHATESYMEDDLGYYYESFYPRDTDDNYNVIAVGNAIQTQLEKSGIGVAHCCEHHDDPQYYGAYDNCAQSINEYLQKYPTIKLVLDIHRDSITTDENEKIKPTFEYNGKKAAQIMIMCGNDNYGYYDFPNWEQNMNLAVKLQSKAESKYPGMTRPLYFGNFMYNMNLGQTSLLIEMGTDANTLEEAVYSGQLLGDVISSVLKE